MSDFGAPNKLMITLAREAKGMTQAQLALALNVSQSKIAKFEAGSLLPSSAEIDELARVLEQPADFFALADQQYGPGSSCFYHYRRRKAVLARDFHRIHATINILRMNLFRVLRGAAQITPNSIPAIDIDLMNGDAETIARMVRSTWRLPAGPIEDLAETIEDAGAYIIRRNFGCGEIDAISQVVPGMPPLIFVNFEMSPERIRHSLAHELGHLVMHSGVSEEPESEADRFAAEFLMPEADIRSEFRSPVTIQTLAALKPRWRVSMRSLVYRAKTLGAITETQAKWLYIKMSKMGWTRREPVAVEPEAPSAVAELIRWRREDQRMSLGQIADLGVMTERALRREFLGEGEFGPRFVVA